MFALHQVTAKLVYVNPRAEMHGDSPMLAADLKFEITVAARMLAMFSPVLHNFLFTAAEQGSLLLDERENLTALRLPALGALRWEEEQDDSTITLHKINGADDLQIQGAKVGKFIIRPQEGGSVEISFQVAVHPTEQALAHICSLLAYRIPVSITLPPARADGLDLQ